MTSKEREYIGQLASGVRQSPVLNAIIQQINIAKNVVTTASDATGSALKENERVLDSIQGRINLFKASVENMWSKLIDTGAMKAFVDSGTILINILDKILNSFDGFIAKTILLATVLGLATTGIMKTVQSTKSLVESIIKVVTGRVAETAATTADTVATNVNTAAKTANVAISGKMMLGFVAISAVIIGLIAAYDALNVTLEEQTDKINSIRAEYDELQTNLEDIEKKQIDVKTQLEQLYKIRRDNGLTDAEKAQLEHLEKTNEQLGIELQYQQALAKQKSDKLQEESAKLLNNKSEKSNNVEIVGNENTGDFTVVSPSLTPQEKLKENIDLLKDYGAQIDNLTKKQQSGAISTEEWKKQSDDLKNKQTELVTENSKLITSIETATVNITDTSGANYDLKVSAEAVIAAAKNEAIVVSGLSINTQTASSATQEMTTKLRALISALQDLTKSSSANISEFNLLKSILDKVKEGYSFSSQEVEALIAQYPDLYDALTYTAGGYKFEESALQSLLSAQGQKAQDGIKSEIEQTNAVIEQVKLRIAAYQTEMLALEHSGKSDVDMQRGEQNLNRQYDEDIARLELYQDKLSGLLKQGGGVNLDLNNYTEKAKKEKTAIELLSEAFSDLINDREHEIELLSKQEGTEAQQISMYERLQKVVHAQAEKYRKMGFDNNSQYVQSLTDLWWKYAENIKSLNQSIADAQAEAQKKQLDYLSSYVDKYKSYLEDEQNLKEDSLNNTIDALEKEADAFDKLYDDKIEKEKAAQEANEKAINARIESLKTAQQTEEDAIQARLDAVKAEHDAQADVNKLLELQNELLRAKEELANAQKERNVKQLQGETWQWIADPNTIADLTDAVTNAQNALNTETAEQSYARTVAELEALQTQVTESYTTQIATLEAQLEADNANYEATIASLEALQESTSESYKSRVEAFKTDLENSKETYSNTVDALDDMVQRQTDLLEGNVTAIVDSLAKLNSELSKYGMSVTQTDSGYSVGSASSGIVQAGADGKAPSGLSAGQLVKTNGGIYQITKVNADGTYVSSLVKKYHGGTASVGDGTPVNGQKEYFAVLKQGEMVLTQGQIKSAIALSSANLGQSNMSSIASNNSSNSSNSNTIHVGNLYVNEVDNGRKFAQDFINWGKVSNGQ